VLLSVHTFVTNGGGKRRRRFNSFHDSVHLFNSGLYLKKKEKHCWTLEKKNTHIVSILLLTEGTFRCLYRGDVLHK
jgi:hypothetical protein